MRRVLGGVIIGTFTLVLPSVVVALAGGPWWAWAAIFAGVVGGASLLAWGIDLLVGGR